MLQSVPSLKSVLECKRVSGDEQITHTSMGAPIKGSFHITDFSEQSIFFQNYVDYVFVRKKEASIIERHVDGISPLLYDLDFRMVDQTVPSRLYTRDFVDSFVTICASVMWRYLNIESAEFYVLEKPEPDSTSLLGRDGVHIMVPDVCVISDVQHLIRRDILVEIEHLVDAGGWSNDAASIVDESIIDRNGWLMYGSSKPGRASYALTRIVRVVNDDTRGTYISDIFEDDEIYKKLNVSHFLEMSKALVQLLSIRGSDMMNRLVQLRENTMDIVEQWREDTTLTVDTTRAIRGTSTEDIETVRGLVEILSSTRAESYTTWMEVGWCLHNISDTLIDIWIEFSLRSPEHASNAVIDCTRKWQSMRETGFGLGSLHLWAKSDNPAEYKRIIEGTLEYDLRRCASCLEDSKSVELCYYYVCALLKRYGTNYVCSSYANRTWWYFNDSRWERDDSDVRVKALIREEFYEVIFKFRAKYVQLSTVVRDEKQRSMFRETSEALTKLARKSRCFKFRKNLVEEASERFIFKRTCGYTRFEEILDTNPMLIGLENGVYDLEMHEFRPGRYEDYMSKSTKNDYIEYSWDSPEVVSVLQFVAKIVPVYDVREYVLTLLASFLDGTTASEKFHIWTGSGGNGKSKLIELFELAFGSYCGKLSVSAFTQRRAASSAPTPEIAKLVGIRFVVTQEPEHNEKFNVGFMKELTGGDKIQARALHQDPIEFKPQFKTILTCNSLPKVPSDDGGTWRRLRVVEFTSKFVDNPTENGEFKIDPYLNERLIEWRHAFFWILTRYYKYYRQGGDGREPGLKEPNSVCVATQAYRKSNDLYADFCESSLCSQNGAVLLIDDAYNEFTTWYRENVNELRCPSKREMTLALQKRLGKPTLGTRAWENYILSRTQSSEDDF